MTSQVVLESPSGKKLVSRVLLDSGALVSLVSNRLVQCLQLPKTLHQLSLSGVQGIHTNFNNCLVTFTVSPTQLSTSRVQLTAAVVNKVTCDLPLQGASSVRSLPHLKHLTLADPTFDRPGRVDLLIGCDIWQDIMLPDTKHGQSQEPMARNTIFSWVIIGIYSPDPSLHLLQCAQ